MKIEAKEITAAVIEAKAKQLWEIYNREECPNSAVRWSHATDQTGWLAVADAVLRDKSINFEPTPTTPKTCVHGTALDEKCNLCTTLWLQPTNDRGEGVLDTMQAMLEGIETKVNELLARSAEERTEEYKLIQAFLASRKVPS